MPSDELEARIYDFIGSAHRAPHLSSIDVARSTVEVLRMLVAKEEWKNAKELLELVRTQGRRLTDGVTSEATIGNMVRRVMKIIRDEYVLVKKNKQEEIDPQESLHKMVTQEEQTVDYSQHLPNLKEAILDNLEELLTELENCMDNISGQALEHIHANEMIMTIGYSRTVDCFLKHAAKERSFHVIVVEGGPLHPGQQLAKSLAKAKIETTLIPDAAIFAMMSRVNKVIIGTQMVLANGGLQAVAGTHTMALAASHYSVPLVVLAPMLKLSPTYLCSSQKPPFNCFRSPCGSLDYSQGHLLSQVHVCSPVLDFVPPDLVTLFISNMGGHAPSYIYRLLSELYSTDDYNL